jgi:hypothetical protein
LQAAHRFVAGIMADPRSNVDRGLYAVQAVHIIICVCCNKSFTRTVNLFFLAAEKIA